MIYGFEFSIYKGTASSQPCSWLKTDTECQVWAQILRATFNLKLVLEAKTSANVNKKSNLCCLFLIKRAIFMKIHVFTV